MFHYKNNEYNTVNLLLQDTTDSHFNLTRKSFLSNILHVVDKPAISLDGYGFARLNQIVVDRNHHYNINSYGYRGPEFSDAELVFAGCSQTFGMGVPEDAIWGVNIAKEFNFRYANISNPGASVQWIIQKLFGYFKEIGNPKYLFCLFPDFYRMASPINKHTFITDRNNGNSDICISHIFLGNRTFDEEYSKPKYSKRPYIAEDVLPFELPVYISFQMISMLEQYCLSNNIKFLWSTYFNDAADFFSHIENKYDCFKNYVPLGLDSFKDNNIEEYFINPITKERIDCHLELKEKYNHCFSKGTDYEDEIGLSHMGVHRHKHISDVFAKFIRDESNK